MIVFHHGLLVPGRLTVVGRTIGSFVGIDRVFTERGHAAVVTQVHPTASIARRAGQLKHSILEWLKCLQNHPDAARDCAGGGDGRVVIVAHSMGGLDARHMITHLGMETRVAALVTLSTPHRGSPYADWCFRQLGRFGAFRVLRAVGLDVGAANDLTTESCARFNERTPDAPSYTDPVERVTAAATPGTRAGPSGKAVTWSRASSRLVVKAERSSVCISVLPV